MKNLKTTLLMAAFAFAFAPVVFAQNTEASLTPAMEKPNAPATAVVGKEIVITVKNTAEKSVVIFGGPKENIREPKVNVFGGLSLNKLYLHENEVVCLMTNEKKPMACTMIKPGVSSVEVNASANGISGR